MPDNSGLKKVVVGAAVVNVTARNPDIAASPRACASGGCPAMVATDGTDTTPVITETYFSEVYIPEAMTLSGVAILNGSAVAGNVTVWICDGTGAAVYAAKSASTAQAGIAGYQKISFATPYQAAEGTYYACVQFSSTSARYRSHAVGIFGAGKATGQTYGTAHSITAPTTFTAGQGPICSLY